jgi:hypothetical protein
LDARVAGRLIGCINVLRPVGIVYRKGEWRVARINPKALKVGVFGLNMQDPTIRRFEEKGHSMVCLNGGVTPDLSFVFSPDEFDVVIGPRCWRIDPQLKLGDDVSEEESLERQLEMMERGIRNIKYPKEKKDVTQ